MTGDVQRLLYEEARLLDAGRLDEWARWLAPDLRYWAPVRAELSRADEAAGAASRLPLFDETRESLLLRIERLKTGFAWCDIPPSRTRRLVSNVMADDASGGRLRVSSNFMLFRSRGAADETLLVGARDDVWSLDGASWRLHERRITLDHRTVENLSLLL